MKILRKTIILFLFLFCLAAIAFPAAASTFTEYEGLEVTVEMDKEQYDEGEPITATITVTNTNNHSVNVVNLEQLIPEGYVLAADSEASKSDFEIKPGETVVLAVTFEGQPAEPQEGEAESGGFFDKLLYGYTWGIPNLLLVVIGLIAFGIFMFLT